MKRTIIKIDETICNGCGACIDGCHESALQLIEGKARIVSELFCDGLGACIGECPVGAIELEEREAEPYNECMVMERIAPKGEKTILAHLIHLRDHNEIEYFNQGLSYLKEHNISIDIPEKAKTKTACGCPSEREMSFTPEIVSTASLNSMDLKPMSQLRQWPVQLHLLNPEASYFKNADVVLAADCAAYTFTDFHNKFIAGKILAIACPKLDSNKESYIQKITAMINNSLINTLTVVVMEVPCCGGLINLARTALLQSTRKIPIKQVVIGIRGDILSEEWV